MITWEKRRNIFNDSREGKYTSGVSEIFDSNKEGKLIQQLLQLKGTKYYA